MKKLVLILLLLSTSAFAAGTFTISGETDSSVIKMTRIYNAATSYNYGGAVLSYVLWDDASAIVKTLFHVTTLADSMRHVQTDSGSIVWDSALVTFTTGATNAGSGIVGFYKLKRAWGEGASTGAVAEGASWVCSDSTSSAHTHWGTAGCDNTTNDRSGTVEVRTTTLAGGTNTAFTVPISGATVGDTLGGTATGGLGVVLQATKATDVITTITIHSDDASTANRAYRPKIVVYYHRMEAVNPKSFAITSAAAEDIAATFIDTTTKDVNLGLVNTLEIGRGYSSLKYRNKRILLRFEKMIDSLRTYLASDTGVWTIDSGRIILNVAVAPETADSLKLSIIRLKSGVGTNSRHFSEGIGEGIGGYGATWDSCAMRETGGTGIGKLPWTTNGAKGSADTVGGVIEEIGWLTPANAAVGADVSWKMTTASLTDTTTDTTAAKYPGWLIWTTGYATAAGNTAQVINFDSDDAADATERPKLSVYLTNTKNIIAPAAPSTLNARANSTLVGTRGTNTGGSVRGKQ
jgi:hypothetical protein